MPASLLTVTPLTASGISHVGFNGSSVTGLVAWYDASQLSGFVDGNSITTITDLSGAGNHGSSSGTLRPTYKVSIAANDLPVIRYAGAGDRSVATFTLNQPASFAFTFQITSALTSTIQRDIVNGIGATAFAGLSLNNSDASLIGFFSNFAADGTSHITSNKWYSMVAVFNGASSKLYLNGSLDTTANAGVNNPGGVSLAARSTGAIPTQVDIGEVIVTSNAMTPTTVANVASYFQRWGT